MDYGHGPACAYTWIRYTDRMPKWKEGAREFTVVVNFHETRGYQLNVPRPVMELLDRPERLTFVIRRQRVEVRPASLDP